MENIANYLQKLIDEYLKTLKTDRYKEKAFFNVDEYYADLLINVKEEFVTELKRGQNQPLVSPKIADLTIGQKIDAIIKWQTDGKVHPLTCGCSATNNDEKQFEIIGTRIKGKPVFIECTRCGVVQDWIPDCVYNYYIQSNFTG